MRRRFALLAAVLALVACQRIQPTHRRYYGAVDPPAQQRRYTATEANALAAKSCKGRSLKVVHCYLTIHSATK